MKIKNFNYFLIIITFSSFMSFFMVFYPNDIYPTTIAAHNGYLSLKNIIEDYNVTIFKGASFYYIFYFLLYPIIKNSLNVIFLYYYSYFIFWGIVVFIALKQFNKLDTWNFLIGLSLSVNESMIYGVSSFMFSMVYLIFSYPLLYKLKDNDTKYFFFVVFSFIVLHFLHPYSNLMFSFISSYIYFYKKEKDSKKFFIKMITISFILISLEAVISFLFSYNDSEVVLLFKNFIKRDIIKFLYYEFIERKISHLLFQVRHTINLIILPLTAYFATFCKFKKEYLGFISLIIIVSLLVPEFFPTTHSFGLRFIPLILFFLLLFGEEIDIKMKKFISILVFFSSLLIIFNIFLLNKVIPYPFTASTLSHRFDITHEILKEAEMRGYKKIAFGNIHELFYYYLLEMMDKKNFVYSYAYTFTSHPVSPKRGITTIYEAKFMELYSNNFIYYYSTLMSKKYFINELCKNFDMFVYIDYYEEDFYVSLEEIKRRGNLHIYECKT